MSSFKRILPTSSLAALLLAAAVAACSSSTGGTDETSTPNPTDPTKVTSPEAPGEEPVTPSKTLPLRDAVDATIRSTLEAAGVDLAKLPTDLEEVAKDRDQLKAVMKSFTLALGTTCDGCHVKNGTKLDFKAESPKKKVAAKMWTSFVRDLKRADGAPLYCDSCHQGKMEFLDRADPRSLSAWMKDNFVTKLVRADGKPHGCETCHGTTFNGEFLTAWAQ